VVRPIATYYFNLRNDFEYKILNTKKNDCGNLLAVDIEDKNITLINIYGPNNDTPLVYNKVSETIEYFLNGSVKLYISIISKT
jgi:hypothetical protein